MTSGSGLRAVMSVRSTGGTGKKNAPMWRWSGDFFGYRDKDNLYTHDGDHIGRFKGREVYDRYGRYIGEIQQSDRLVTSEAKRFMGGPGFVPEPKRISQAKHSKQTSNSMPIGHKDFPEPAELKPR